ncbi:MAG: NIL domain-containing protein [Spirochaetia bacterium]|jgi:ABC-type methionine transport system ATPase subunit
MIKKVELTINGTLNKEPLIYNIIKNFDVVPNIVEASFSTTMGWAIIEFEGEDEELDRVLAYLSEKSGVDVKFS